MTRKILFIVGLLFLSYNLIAAPIDVITAEKAASNFLKLKSELFNVKVGNSVVRDITPLVQGETMAYIVNFTEGFVIIAADDASRPILGYSYYGSFIADEMPLVINDWMQMYILQIKDIRERNLVATNEIKQEWTDLLNFKSRGSNDLREVQPLLTALWNQGAKYNELCPEADGGPGGHVVTGCVATAMSQVINYWRYPSVGSGTHGYYSDYGYLSVDYSSSEYDYNQMNSSINGESNHEMAEIQYHCGVAVNMMYSPTSSGAYSEDAAAALRTYFTYSTDLNLVFKEDYSDIEWAELLITNLNNGWPLYYHGFGTGGHAFNVDGYQGSDYFHFNWGWGGSYNGYFYLTNLNPGGNNFTYGQGAIVNFHPNFSAYPYYCSGVTTLTRHNGTIQDGSGPVNNYLSNSNCGWLIAPQDSITDLTLYFDLFNLGSGDVLNIFDGQNTSAPTIGSFTATNIPSVIHSSSGSLYIEFLTSSDQGKGWSAHYTSALANYCSGISNHTAPAGTFTDGSGSRDYNNNSFCKHIIEPDNASTIIISFNSFDTEPIFDKVKIFDLTTSTLIAELSGNGIPADVIIPSGRAYVLFSSNSSVTAAGWELSYSSTVTTTETLKTNGFSVNCSPNPVDDWLRIDIKATLSQLIDIDIISANGKSQKLFHGLTTVEPMVVMADLSKYAPGLYLIRYNTGTETGTMKIIIK